MAEARLKCANQWTTWSRIDAHQHYWRIDRGDYGWLTPVLDTIYRDFLPEDLAAILKRHGIDRTIAVQAAPTIAETEFLLGLARQTGSIAGVVGWVDFAESNAPSTIARLARERALVGLRPMVQDIADDDWLPVLSWRRVSALIEHQLVFDALVLPRHLPRLARVVARYPQLTVVIDHGAKPPIREGVSGLDPWREDIAALAAEPRVHCKLSGLVTEASTLWQIEDLRPYVDHLLSTFGAEKLIWGSDWPVVELGGDTTAGARRRLSCLRASTRTHARRCWAATPRRCIFSAAFAPDAGERRTTMLKGIDPLLTADLLWVAKGRHLGSLRQGR
jgi:L-fuconolactonase